MIAEVFSRWMRGANATAARFATAGGARLTILAAYNKRLEHGRPCADWLPLSDGCGGYLRDIPCELRLVTATRNDDDVTTFGRSYTLTTANALSGVSEAMRVVVGWGDDSAESRFDIVAIERDASGVRLHLSKVTIWPE